MKHEILKFLLFALLVSAFLSVALIPWQNNLSGFSFASFSVGLEVQHLAYDTNNIMQLTPVFVNGPDVNLSLNVSYYGSGNMNVSFTKPQNYTCTDAIFVRENNLPKSAYDNGTHIIWTANKSAGGATILFAAPAPFIYEQTEALDQEYENEIKISSCAHLINATAEVNLTTGFEPYRLYLVVNGARQDKTSEYRFSVNGSQASFSSFNLSNQTFIIVGTMEEDEDDDRHAHNIGFFGFRNETQGNTTIPEIENEFAEFTVRPREIKASSLGIYSSKIRVQNIGEQEVTLTLTSGPAVQIADKITLESGEMREVSFIINHNVPGTYYEEIKVSADGLTRIAGILITITQPPAMPKPTINTGTPPKEQAPRNITLPLNEILIDFVGLMVLLAIFIHVITKYSLRHKL
jgi:hypothetical protein